MNLFALSMYWVPRSCVFARAGTTDAYATGLVRKREQIVSAASPPALAKKRKDGAPTVSERERKNVGKGGPPAQHNAGWGQLHV